MNTVRTTYSSLFTAAMFLLLAASNALAQPNLQIQRIVSRWPVISVYYSIHCGAQLNLSHTAQQMTLREEGVPVAAFTKHCPDTTAVGNISFGLVLDGSGSTIGAPNQWIKAGANAFIEKMKSTDEGAVLHFATSSTLVQAMTADSAALKAAANQLTAAGASGVYSAIHAGLTHVGNTASKSRRAVIIVTDGGDNSSLHSPGDVAALSVQLGIPVVIIGVGASLPTNEFIALATQTGGHFILALDANGVRQAFQDAYELVADEFQMCRLEYTAVCTDGTLRMVELEVNGVCSGSDIDNEQYRAPMDTTGRTQLVLAGPATEALATKSFTVPVSIASVTPGLLHPFDMDLLLSFNCMTLDSVSVPPGSPLAGTSLIGYPVSGYTRVRSGVKVPVNGPGPLLNLHFTGAARVDSVSCSITVQNMTYAAGCYITPSVTIPVNLGIPPLPVVSPSGRITLCPGETVTLTANDGYDSYEWSTTSNSRSIVVSSAGNYTVTVMDRAGRTATSAPVEVAYRASPNPRLTVGPTLNLCEGNSVLVGVTGTFPSYQWSTGMPTNSILVTQAGSYFVTVTDDHGCSWNSDTVVVTVSDPEVSVTASGPLTICDGEAVTLDAGPGFASYLWSNNEQTRSIVVRSSGSYFVKATEAGGCTATSDTVEVVVRSKPIAGIIASGPLALCPGDSLILEGSPLFSSWQWSTGASTRSIIVTQAGTYGLSVMDAFGCRSDTAAVVVTVEQRPVLNLPDTVFICPTGAVVMDAGAGYASYQWSQGATTRSIQVNSAGTYFVRVSTALGCIMYSDTVMVELREQLKPVVTLSGSARICEGDSLELDGGDYTSWDWSTGEKSRRIIVRSGGNYSVSVTDAYGCSGSSDPVAITVVPAPVPTVQALTPTRVCEGDTVVLVASQGFVDYAWSNGRVGATIRVTSTGSYSVTVTNADGCKGTSPPMSVTVVPLPEQPTITRSGDTLLSSPAAAYQWLQNGSILVGATGRSLIPAVSGSYVVRVFNADGCFSDSDPMTVVGSPSAQPHRPRDLSLYPDPTSGRVTISGEIDRGIGLEITATNLLGQIVARLADKGAKGAFTRGIDITAAPRGVYLLHIRYGDRVIVRRIVKT
jgi:hypothetical protein